MTRDIEITHEQLRAVDRPVADYLYVRSLAEGKASERGLRFTGWEYWSR